MPELKVFFALLLSLRGHVFTNHVYRCVQCRRMARATKLGIALQRYAEPHLATRTAAEVAATSTVCMGCTQGADVPGEIVRRCEPGTGRDALKWIPA